MATALMHIDGMAPTSDGAEQAQREDAEAIEAAWVAVERNSLALVILPVEG